jgi:hypothetical protein
LKHRTIISAFAAALACSVLAVAAAANGTPRELYRNAFLAPAGHVAKLAAGVTYKASDFPLPIRVTSPDGSWGGAQWKSDSSYQHTKSTVAPFYGWVTFEQHDTRAAQGAITIMTPYGSTPTVAAMVAGLRTRGHGARRHSSSLHSCRTCREGPTAGLPASLVDRNGALMEPSGRNQRQPAAKATAAKGAQPGRSATGGNARQPFRSAW